MTLSPSVVLICSKTLRRHSIELGVSGHAVSLGLLLLDYIIQGFVSCDLSNSFSWILQSVHFPGQIAINDINYCCNWFSLVYNQSWLHDVYYPISLVYFFDRTANVPTILIRPKMEGGKIISKQVFVKGVLLSAFSGIPTFNHLNVDFCCK